MTDLVTTWWIWLAGALVLAILEILAPGFVFLGFAVGAAAVGLLLLGPAQLLSIPMILLVFAALSLVAWLIMRRIFALPTGQVKTFDHDIND
ncbi:MAG: NfeD family protein [Shimia sp.]|jgi:membrane protein implicated in regulation of membrane protease activity|uniref:NfeD family protein n=1 Tax=Shimia sp. TaxID=1954381 RepID=UPI004058BAA2